MHRKFLILAFSLILIATSLITSISVILIANNLRTLPLERPYQTLEASTTNYSLKLTIKLDKTQFRQGENISVRLSLTNVSNRTVKLIFSCICKYRNFDYAISNVYGIETYRWGYGKFCLGALWDLTLGPGEEVRETMFWPQGLSWDTGYSQVPPGTYLIKGRLPSGGIFTARIDSEPAMKLVLITPAITFRIRSL